MRKAVISGFDFLLYLSGSFGFALPMLSTMYRKRCRYYSCNACRANFRSRDEAIKAKLASHEPTFEGLFGLAWNSDGNAGRNHTAHQL